MLYWCVNGAATSGSMAWNVSLVAAGANGYVFGGGCVPGVRRLVSRRSSGNPSNPMVGVPECEPAVARPRLPRVAAVYPAEEVRRRLREGHRVPATNHGLVAQQRRQPFVSHRWTPRGADTGSDVVPVGLVGGIRVVVLLEDRVLAGERARLEQVPLSDVARSCAGQPVDHRPVLRRRQAPVVLDREPDLVPKTSRQRQSGLHAPRVRDEEAQAVGDDTVSPFAVEVVRRAIPLVVPMMAADASGDKGYKLRA